MELNGHSARPDDKMENTAKKEASRNGRRVLEVGKGQPGPLPNPALWKRLDCREDVGSKETAANPEKNGHGVSFHRGGGI